LENWKKNIERMARGIRSRVLEHTINNNGGYLSQACSSAEILASLYGRILKIEDAGIPELPGRFNGVPGPENKNYRNGSSFNGEKSSYYDRFFLSPSQYSLVLYAALIEAGRMDQHGLAEFNKDGGTVEMIGAEHSPGMEIMSGSLGQGISQAFGIAMARKLKKETGRVVLFMSDGEFQIGQTWEALQAAAFHRLNNILIFVDVNGYQCDGRMTDVMNIEPLDKRLEAFGIRSYRINGHDIDSLVKYGTMEPDGERPTCVLCDTIPYRDLDVLKKREPKFHYVRFAGPDEKNELAAFSGTAVKPSAGTSSVIKDNGLLSRVHAKNLVAWAKDRPEVVVLSADLTSSVEIDAFRDTYPGRFFSMGIAEQNMLSFAGGLAREGYVPFVHTFAVFIYRRAFDQIAMSVAYPDLPVKMFGFLPGIMTPGGATHQAIEDVAVMRSLPNMTILDCGDATDVESVPDAVMSVNGPVYVRMIRGEIPRLFDKSEPMVVGKSRRLSSGNDIVLLPSGICTEEALRATDALKRYNVGISHFHVTTLKPFNDEEIIDAIEKSKHGVITMENHTIIGGLGTIISEKIAELGLSKKLVRIGLNDTFVHGASKEYLMKEYGLDAMKLVRTVESMIKQRPLITEEDLGEIKITAVHSPAKPEAL